MHINPRAQNFCVLLEHYLNFAQNGKCQYKRAVAPSEVGAIEVTKVADDITRREMLPNLGSISAA